MKSELAPALSVSRPAPAAVAFAHVEGKTVVTECRGGSPLKLLVPRQRDTSAWVIAATYGGGLLAGDRVQLDVHVQPAARGLIGTQASTKIYRSDGRTSSQTLQATADAGSLLAVLPDPVVCFAGARYEQSQRFDLAAGASLLLVDSFTAGRVARGERWAMTRYRSVNDVFVAGRRVARDATLLDGAMGQPFVTGRFNCFSTLLAVGPLLADHAAAMAESVRRRKLTRQPDLLVATSPLADGCIIRVAGVEIEQTTQAMRNLLTFVPELLGDDPFARKW